MPSEYILYHWSGIIWAPSFLVDYLTDCSRTQLVPSNIPVLDINSIAREETCSKHGGNFLKFSLLIHSRFCFQTENILSFFMYWFHLLRYNSHRTKFTLLKCIIQCFLAYSQICITTTSISRTFSLSLKNSFPSRVSPHYPLSLVLENTNRLCLSIDLQIPEIFLLMELSCLAHLACFQGLFSL